MKRDDKGPLVTPFLQKTEKNESQDFVFLSTRVPRPGGPTDFRHAPGSREVGHSAQVRGRGPERAAAAAAAGAPAGPMHHSGERCLNVPPSWDETSQRL